MDKLTVPVFQGIFENMDFNGLVQRVGHLIGGIPWGFWGRLSLDWFKFLVCQFSLKLTSNANEKMFWAPKESRSICKNHPFSGAKCQFQGGYTTL